MSYTISIYPMQYCIHPYTVSIHNTQIGCAIAAIHNAQYVLSNLTARPYGLPARLEWSSNIIVDMLKSLRRASVLVFTRRRTLNPKTLEP